MSINPLTPQMIAELKQRKNELPVLKSAIDKAKRAGIDTSAQEERYNQQVKQVDALLREYGTGL
jgi:hypothetical protein